MNIIFVDEDDRHGLSIYMDPKTMKKHGYVSDPIEGLYYYYYDGHRRGVTLQSREPFPCVFL